MIHEPDAYSTRPYFIRALYEWCTDNAFTPLIAVSVDASVRVPSEYVKDGEIVLNVSFDATSGLKLGNEFIEFKGRFGGVARDILVPVNKVIAIYARENGNGMVFPSHFADFLNDFPSNFLENQGHDSNQVGPQKQDLNAPRPPGGRPTLTRVK